MFQPQPTPYSPSYTSYGVHIANAEVPEYAFQPTPLVQFGTGQSGGSGGSLGGAGVGAVPGSGRPTTTADVFASHIFHNPNSLISTPANNPSHHLPYNHSNSQIPHNHHQTRRNIKMEPQLQTDLAQQEAAAREFKPQLEGPLVGERRPSTEITEEYAKADPIYVAKTLALPQTYSHYRPIQGDGNCGWRAIAFGYFESLVRRGDANEVSGEQSRINSFNHYIEHVGGHSSWLFEDMVGETWSLLQAIATAMSTGQDPMDLVMDKFNNPESSQSIVYHMRLIASSWLKGHAANYEPWIPGTIENYNQDTIMPIDREIDHIGVVLLHEFLLKPAGIVLEIAYLDRSDGVEVNVHRMPEEANGQDPATLGPMIYLLYRPGHYDILYRDSVIQTAPPMPPAPTTLSINRATSFTHHHEIENTMPSLPDFAVDMSALAMIPGFGAPAEISPLASPAAAPSPLTDPYAPSPQSPWMPQPFPDGLATRAPPPQPSPPQQQPTTPMTVHPLRFSKYNFPDLVETSFHEPAFTTNTFKNSHFNVAHYNNMNFQPEMYRPEAEEEIPHGKGGGRKRSSEHCGAVIKKENRG
ncbi:cysteine proteinase [Annulohypoxylon truncatum]|uniref:cysteine proteinase n=1 Tax=Annulohypoxylon truncatum TaxID=327061 RepID=UPI0020078639|nr:cysteine proteinase [Annulohypoxylon truncatum]KAI1204883.1 cysteine proteinase [Annulohypoxylon truncatum]